MAEQAVGLLRGEGMILSQPLRLTDPSAEGVFGGNASADVGLRLCEGGGFPITPASAEALICL